MGYSEKRGIISKNLEKVRLGIREVCANSGRNPEDVRLVAVTKTVGIEEVKILAELGVADFGENRIQPALEKIKAMPDSLCWHMIGHLQRNKVRTALEIFDRIDTVDSLRLAGEISRRAGEGAEASVLVELNTGGEAQKHGFTPQDARQAVMDISRLPGLKVEGLMTMAPFTDDMEVSRGCFRVLRETSDALRERGLDLPHLSMGMTQDYKTAVEEGSTMVRVGSALFQGL